MPDSDFRARQRRIPVASEGIPYIAAAAFTTLIFAILGWGVLTVASLVVALLVGHFFRDPERVITAAEAEVVSPADGNVIGIVRVDAARFTGKAAQKISIFMSVFDVHVNRAPVSGTIQGLLYKKGRFMAANFAESSEKNEQNWLWIKDDAGCDVVITQVAGLIARRIVCWPGVGDRLLKGERFGMIRFGSRMDVYVPEDCEILVRRGQHVFAGETSLCRLS